MVKDPYFRDFVIMVTNVDGKVVGTSTLEGMGKDNEFADILAYEYVQNKYSIEQREHKLEDEDFTVTVSKLDTLGRKHVIGEMEVCCEGDSSFEEIIELAYHGCTDD